MNLIKLEDLNVLPLEKKWIKNLRKCYWMKRTTKLDKNST